MFLRDEAQYTQHVAARVRVAVEIEFGIADLVPVPGNAKVDRIDAEILVPAERLEPEVSRNAKIIKLGGVNKKWDAVDTQFGFARVGNYLYARGWANRFLRRSFLGPGAR